MPAACCCCCRGGTLMRAGAVAHAQGPGTAAPGGKGHSTIRGGGCCPLPPGHHLGCCTRGAMCGPGAGAAKERSRLAGGRACRSTGLAGGPARLLLLAPGRQPPGDMPTPSRAGGGRERTPMPGQVLLGPTLEHSGADAAGAQRAIPTDAAPPGEGVGLQELKDRPLAALPESLGSCNAGGRLRGQYSPPRLSVGQVEALTAVGAGASSELATSHAAAASLKGVKAALSPVLTSLSPSQVPLGVEEMLSMPPEGAGAAPTAARRWPGGGVPARALSAAAATCAGSRLIHSCTWGDQAMAAGAIRYCSTEDHKPIIRQHHRQAECAQANKCKAAVACNSRLLTCAWVVKAEHTTHAVIALHGDMVPVDSQCTQSQ